uniref:Uncharacterized protein n=1 Tax=Arundo donax TaxID=35708 RepID=A0A0A9B732_ARUDO
MLMLFGLKGYYAVVEIRTHNLIFIVRTVQRFDV